MQARNDNGRRPLRLGVYTLSVAGGKTVVVKGGASRYLDDLLTRLPKDQFEIVFFTGEPETPSAGTVETDHRSPGLARRLWRKLPESLRLAIGLARETWALRNQIKAAKLDVFHSNYAGFEIAPIAARLAGVKNVVALYHNLPSEEFTTSRWLQLLVENLNGWCATVPVAVTQGTARDWEARCRAVRGRFVVIYNGVDFEQIESAASPAFSRAELGLPENAPVLAVVARLHPMKGIPYLLDAMPAILKKHPSAQLVLVGDGAERPALEAQVQRLSLEKCVHFLGWRTDALRIVPACDVVVMPSIFLETWGYALAEAMTLGKPCVATDVGGMRELVADGETGFIVPRRDSAALAGAIGRLLDDPGMAKRFGAAGRQRVEQMFGVDRMVEETVAVYLQSDKSPAQETPAKIEPVASRL